jgi:hypothetical protein
MARMAARPGPRDRDGRLLKVGDVVRVVGVPELSGMSEASRRDCLPVFRHLVGTYRTINAFDELGFAELSFEIRRGAHRGMHWVTLEPYLLKRREERTPPAKRQAPERRRRAL